MKWSTTTGLAILCSTLILSGGTALGETLQEAVGEVLQTNPQVRTQAYNRLARDEEVKQAKSAYWPTADFTAGTGIEEIDKPEESSLDPVEIRLSLRQNVFAGFSTKNEVSRQKARVRSSAYRLRGVSENLALETSKVYLDVLRREELKVLAEENLLTHERIADQIRLRSESGVGTEVDLDQVQGRLSLAQANVVVTETNLLDAQTNYLAVVGHMPDSLLRPDSPDDMIPPNLDAAASNALIGHPTLKSAQADLEARYEQYEVAKSPFWPRVDLEVDQNWDEDVDGVEGEQESTVAMIRLRYNLFQGFSDQARKAETKQLIEEAREIKNNTHRQVVESIRLSWRAYQSVLDRMKYLQQHVESSTATVESYAKQFDLGKRTLLDVLDSEAEVVEAKRDLIDATYDGLYAQYRILNGMGGLVGALGLELPEESKVESEDEAEMQEVAAD
ncbi:TolC family outer membrane protein [Desulfosediminicola flagellatus]|uniref:TolC family outer membrane protein n=1 Tax=Desulfosediminicola flagellatus TaxID=2569541 RepID=UPI0010AC61D2|nr:TolC family outer membrane protein [Desulfosediminicola flagellatus]